MNKQIRKENLKQLRQEYGESFQQALASENLTPEQFSQVSLMPIGIIEDHMTGELRHIGYLSYAASCLNKKLKIELID